MSNEEACVNSLLADTTGSWMMNSKDENLIKLREMGLNANIVASVIGNFRSRWRLAYLDMEDARLGGTMLNMAQDMKHKSPHLDRLLRQMLLYIEADVMTLEARFLMEERTNSKTVDDHVRAVSCALVAKRKSMVENLLQQL